VGIVAGLTKGVGYVNVRAFVEERGTDGAWDRVLGALRHEDADTCRAAIASGWYSLDAYARLIREVDTQIGKGDLARVEELGRFEAERDLKFIHRAFLRMFNAVTVIEKFVEYWERFHDTGKWELTRPTDTALDARLSGWGVADEGMCRELVGYLPRSLELVGAKNVRVRHTACRARGAPHCRFEGRWTT
jgi:predicted hydrocarbon binding protein